jgi:hypothetical protein
VTAVVLKILIRIMGKVQKIRAIAMIPILLK